MTHSTFQYRTRTQCVSMLVETLALSADFWRHAELHHADPFAFLLDSASQQQGLGRYSFLGGAPWLVYRARHPQSADRVLGWGDIELEYRDGLQPMAAPRVERLSVDVFGDLAQRLAELAMPKSVRAELGLPFVGGAVGYVSYDANRFLERLPDIAARDLDLPEICLLFVDQLLAHDHRTGVTQLLSAGRAETPEAARVRAQQLHTSYRSRVQAFESCASADDRRVRVAECAVSVHAPTTEARYVAMVQRAREHILAGDVFEVCVTQRLDAADSGDAWGLYQSLRAINPAPFASYLKLPELCVVSSSPERFLSATRDGQVESRPIKGTRPRGATEAHDAELRAELAASEKDRAENIMIVDLVRNDFGRVCEVDSIHVPELMIIEAHPTVFQMVSTVRAQLCPAHSPLALLGACFPPGSMTGAPKIEAMTIIEALEPSKRGLYAGCVGYFDVGGGMDWSVLIRSFVIARCRCYFSVGGAVVADSDPRAEYAESMVKAQALFDALQHHASKSPR